MPPFLLPYHRYVGPGNNIYNGEPVDIDDAIAQKHDIAYSKAKTWNEIIKADNEAISSFNADFFETYNIHSLIGSIGLQTKVLTEKILGPIYPVMSKEYHDNKNRKGKPYQLSEAQLRWRDENYRRHGHSIVARKPHNWLTPPEITEPSQHDSQAGSSDEPNSKIARLDSPPYTPDTAITPDIQSQGSSSSSDIMDTDMVDAGQVEGGGSKGKSKNLGKSSANLSHGGGGGEHIEEVRISRSLMPHGTYVTYNNSRLITTWGYATVDIVKGTVGSTARHLIGTSLAYLPVDYVPWYLSPAEYEVLPFGSKIVECKVQVFPQGTRVSFDTGTTLTGAANATHTVFGHHVIGLNHKVYKREVTYTTDAATPMKPTAFVEVTPNDIIVKLWGETASNTAITNFPCSYNMIRHLGIYGAMIENTQTGNMGGNNSALQRLDAYVDMYNYNSVINSCIVNYSYKPKAGYLSYPAQYQPLLTQSHVRVNNSYRPQVDYSFALGTNEGTQNVGLDTETNYTLPLGTKPLQYSDLVDKHNVTSSFTHAGGGR